MNHILGNLGLCAKASGLVSGEEIVVEGIKNNEIYYVFLANDVSNNTKKKILDKCNTYNVEVCESFSHIELSKAIGKENRMVIGITNINFLKILKK